MRADCKKFAKNKNNNRPKKIRENSNCCYRIRKWNQREGDCENSEKRVGLWGNLQGRPHRTSGRPSKKDKADTGQTRV